MAEAGNRIWWKIALATCPIIVLLGSASGWLSNSGFGNPWFDRLAKPSFMPPGWVFGLAWTILYVLLGLALAMILAEPPSDRRRTGLTLFFVQLGLNFAWSPIFFAAHDISLAKWVIFAMAAIAAAAAGRFLRLRRAAGLLLVPYLGWLVFAATLNATIEQLNPRAGSPLVGIR
ncbi:TspO/MBR family protein [Sphingomonas sp.]|uniref:TspO/MBR family protein n=1 Tax=Sphingomonas sp. TaxID=28214 RepID=UPI0025D263EB|nr:TspO/MBR family protein [Sphingomonas sp.]MBV9526791.1 tryptophan-rich sensory protein [Sphingomonas sp.]